MTEYDYKQLFAGLLMLSIPVIIFWVIVEALLWLL